MGSIDARRRRRLSGYLLDTTVIVDHAHGHVAGVEVVRRLFEETLDIYTCDVVTCEALSRGDELEIAAVNELLQALEYVALSPHGAKQAGDRRRRLVEAGVRRPSTTDALIAALAQSLDATVVTRNVRDFEPYGVPVLGYGEVG